MNKEIINAPDIKIFESPYIKEIIDLSDDFSEVKNFSQQFGSNILDNLFDSLTMARMRIIFFNNYQLSVIRGTLSHRGDQGLFEIAAYNSLGSMDDTLFDHGEQGGSVLDIAQSNEFNITLIKSARYQLPKAYQLIPNW